MLVLAERIKRAYRGGGFIGAIIYGPQRLGKSSYALKVLYNLYGDWDAVLRYTVFDLKEVITLLSDAVNGGKRIPAIVWDDAGFHASKMLYFQNRALTLYLQRLIDVVGINLGGLLITTPSPSNLLRSLRGYEFFRVKIYSDGGTRRHATGYLSVLLPSGTRVIKREFQDYYDVMLPDAFWGEYVKKRRSYLSQALKDLGDLLQAPTPTP
jgi:AAA+ ATPase superfamily predicted ATPase